MPNRVFSSSHIYINLVPVIADLSITKRFVIVRIHITKKIPTAAGVARHGGGFPHPRPLSTLGGDGCFSAGLVITYSLRVTDSGCAVLCYACRLFADRSFNFF